MKLLIILSALISFSVFAKESKDINKAILQDLSKDIQKDDERFKTKRMRGPASVESAPPVKIQEPQKIDKNVRQIGPNEW